MAMQSRGSETAPGADTATVTSSNLFSPSRIPSSDTVIEYGKLYLNSPYRYGARGASAFDCSGFTSFVYGNFGYKLAHSSAAQAQQFDTVKRTQLKPGDLVYFSGSRKSRRIGHVGIVVEAKEDGKFDFIHASCDKGVTISSSEEPYYSRRFITANRVLGAVPHAQVDLFGVDEPESQDYIVPAATSAIKTKKTIPAKYHSVRSGETLSAIAERYGLTVAELKKKNGLHSNKLSLKQRLKVKDAETYTEIEPIPVIAQAQQTDSEMTSSGTAVAQAETKPVTHVVKRGESLFSISKRYNIPVAELKKINNIEDGRIVAGQALQVSLNQEQMQATEETQPNLSHKSITHRVASGESLFTIAKKYNVSVNDLKKANALTSNNIHAGQTLKVDLVFDNTVNLTEAVQAPETKLLAKAEPEIKHEPVEKPEQPVVRQADKKPMEEETIASENESAKLKDPKLLPGTRIINHKVHAGENLNTIARDFKVSVEELKLVNNLTETRLSPGQEVIVLISPIAGNSAIVGFKPAEAGNNPASENLVATAPSAQAVVKNEIKSAPVQEIGYTSEDLAGEKNDRQQASATYKVKKGDYISAVASKFGLSVAKLKEINNLSSNSLHTGQILRVSAENEVEKKVVQSASQPKPETYTVKKGDYVSSVAAKFGLSVAKLKEINNLTDNNLHVGQTLCVSVVPADKVVAESKPQARTTDYKVRKGESLNAIASKFDMTVEELKNINNLSSSRLNYGQVLKVVRSESEKVAVESKQQSKPATYKVQRGDNLSSIAAKFGQTVEELKEANGLADDRLNYGQELKLAADAVKAVSKDEVAEKSTIHKVKKGETLSTIAQLYDLTVEGLKELNGMINNKLSYGQELIVAKGANQKKTVAKTEGKSRIIHHKVKSGESLYSIAQKYDCSLNDLKEWNKKSGSKLDIGDDVVIYSKKNAAKGI